MVRRSIVAAFGISILSIATAAFAQHEPILDALRSSNSLPERVAAPARADDAPVAQIPPKDTSAITETLLGAWATSGQADAATVERVLRSVDLSRGTREEEDGVVAILKKAGAKYAGGADAFESLVRERLDAARFSKVNRLVQQVMGEFKGVDAALRTGSSAKRHLELLKGAPRADGYRYLFSDDDITFVGAEAVSASARLNELIRGEGLGGAKVKGFDLSHLKELGGLDLLGLELMESEKFLGEAGLGGIKAETLTKGVVIAEKGKPGLLAEPLKDFVDARKSSLLATMFDEKGFVEAVRKYGALTMVGSCERQIVDVHGGWDKLSDPDKVKYVLREQMALNESGALRTVGKQDQVFIDDQIRELKKLRGTANLHLTGKDLDWLVSLRRTNVRFAFMEIPYKMTPILRAARAAGRSLAGNPEVRKAMDELATGFALMRRNALALTEEEILENLRIIAGGDQALYQTLSTSFYQADDMIEAVDQWVKGGGTRESWLKMLLEQPSAKQRAAMTEARKSLMQGKPEEKGLAAMERLFANPQGDGFLVKLIQNPRGIKFLSQAMVVAGGVAFLDGMATRHDQGKLGNDLSDAAFFLLDFPPGGMGIKQAFTVGLDKQAALLFVKDALYLTPAWPLMLGSDVLTMTVELTSAVTTGLRLKTEQEGLVEILVYGGEFDDSGDRPSFLRLKLPRGRVVEKEDLSTFYLTTKAVVVDHPVTGLAYRINDLSRVTSDVLDSVYVANDPVIEQLRQAAATQLEAITKHEMWRPGNPWNLAAGQYLAWAAGFDLVCRNSPDKWCKVYDHLLKTSVEKRRAYLASEVMTPQLIQAAEDMRGKLDASKALKPKLDAVQKKLIAVGGRPLQDREGGPILLSAKVQIAADQSGAGESGATRKAVVAGRYWQEALKTYVRIYDEHKNIQASVLQKTGFEWSKVLQFPFSGDYKDDARRADQSRLGFAADITLVSGDLLKLKGSAPDPADPVDKKAFALLGGVVFPWRGILDGYDLAQPKEGSAFFAEYAKALAAAKLLYGLPKPPPPKPLANVKPQTPAPTPSPTPVQDQPADSSVITFGGTVPGIWDGGNNPRGFDFKRQNAKTTGTGDCKWNAEVQSDISGRIDSSGSADTPEEITKRINDVVASSKARWGATAAVRPFAIGDFKGQFVDTSVVFLPGGWSDGGFRADAVIAGGRGWLIKGRHTVEVAYSVSGSGCWTNVDQAFLMSQASAAQADAKSIVASLTLVEKGSFTKVPYTGPKLDGSDMPKVTLSPPALETLKVGDTVKVSVVVENAKPEDRPFRYGWAGDIEGKPGTSTGSATITIRPKKPGRYPLSVSVDGARYTLGSASLEYEVADLKAEITQQSPATRSVAVGASVTFSARLVSSGVPITGSYIYRWQPTPEVAFQPGEGPATQTKAVFSRPGVTKVWVQILEKKGTVLTTLAESNQLEIEVVNPEITLRMVPAEPYPGQQVRITASETPAVGDAFITYWWEYAGSVLNPGAEANPRVYSFIPKDKTPVTVTAHAKAKDGGDDLGTKAVVVSARPHNVKVTGPTSRGPKPQVWSAQAGRLVDEEQQIAVFQDVSMRADVTPAPVNLPLHYQWTASPESCSISNAISQEPTFNCSQTGSVAAVVTVHDNLGATLGTGTGTISVSISQASLRKSQAQADAAKQAAQQATLAAERKAAAAKQEQASTPVAVVPAPTGTNVVVFKITNIGGFSTSPSAPTQFTISRPHVISYVFTYHWNDGNGSARTGTIALRHANGAVFGPWAATGTPGQGGVPNAGWEVRPNVVIPAGTYTIVDSSPSTWAQNSESGGRGHTIVEGHAVTASASPTPMVTAPPDPPVAPAPAPDRPAPASPASKLPISESAVVKPPAPASPASKLPVAAAPAVPDRVPATGAWVLEKTEFVVEKVDAEYLQKWRPVETGVDGAGSVESTFGHPDPKVNAVRVRMKVEWTSPPRVLIPGKEINFRIVVSDAGSDDVRGLGVGGIGSIGANYPSRSAVWYGPSAGFNLKLGERSKEASKAYTPMQASPGDTMYFAAEFGVFARRQTFYYIYKFTLDASKAPAPVSTSSAPSAIRPASSPAAPAVTPPPPSAEGRGVATWSVSFNGWPGIMELTDRGGAYQGRFNLGGSGWEPMLDLRLEGSAISFRRTQGDQRYVGVISGSAMRGTFSQGGAGSYPWTATKK
ncbi:MAG: BatD family protein [Acidobacteria bacterium]|nr:BatD family protein [Acidobacteriota bacterium]